MSRRSRPFGRDRKPLFRVVEIPFPSLSRVRVLYIATIGIGVPGSGSESRIRTRFGRNFGCFRTESRNFDEKRTNRRNPVGLDCHTVIIDNGNPDLFSGENAQKCTPREKPMARHSWVGGCGYPRVRDIYILDPPAFRGALDPPHPSLI